MTRLPHGNSRPRTPGSLGTLVSAISALRIAPTLCLSLLAALFCWLSSASAAPVPVRFTEGMVSGFLLLRDSGGARIASGEFLQTSRSGEIQSRTRFHFRDGSVHDETAVFTQQRSFVLKSYHLLQKGPAFREDLEVYLERGTGKYRVKVKPHGGPEKLLTGQLDLPLDVYNGMVPAVVKNLVQGARETVHMVAFTPAPRVIELEITPSGEEGVLIGELRRTATRYLLKPKLGLLKIPATLLGRMPPDDQIWIIASEVPAFVKFQGPLATDGPIWRIELTSPVWAK